jgi:hypothetical protein
MHDSGWFIGALKQYKVTKIKGFIIYQLAKICRILPSGRFEDEMHVSIITACKNPHMPC